MTDSAKPLDGATWLLVEADAEMTLPLLMKTFAVEWGEQRAFVVAREPGEHPQKENQHPVDLTLR